MLFLYIALYADDALVSAFGTVLFTVRGRPAAVRIFNGTSYSAEVSSVPYIDEFDQEKLYFNNSLFCYFRGLYFLLIALDGFSNINVGLPCLTFLHPLLCQTDFRKSVQTCRPLPGYPGGLWST